jgi:hypothetical protein
MEPGLDAMIVVDARRHNPDGTLSESYGKVVNFVEVPPRSASRANRITCSMSGRTGNPS